MVRYRETDTRVVPGGGFYRYTWRPNTAAVGTWGDCTDVEDGWDTENPFVLNRYLRQCSTLDGVISANRWCEGFILLAPGHLATPSADKYTVDPDWVDLAWNARAFTNPQRPAVNLPAILGEASDIPGMLADLPLLLGNQGRRLLSRAGRPALRRPDHLFGGKRTLSGRRAQAKRIWAAARQSASETGSQYVGSQFGWKPLVADLTKLLNLQREIAQQLRMLLRLAEGRSIRKRMMLPTTSATDTFSMVTESAYAVIRSQVTEIYRVESWVTSRWAPTVFTRHMIPDLSDAEGLTALAMRLATGMTRMGLMQAWWELLPWSWLVDWWYDIGRILAALGNSLFLSLESLSYQRTSQATRYYAHGAIPSGHAFSGGPDEQRHTRLFRKDLRPYLVLTPPPPISLPLLTGRQLGILAGLCSQAQSKGFRR